MEKKPRKKSEILGGFSKTGGKSSRVGKVKFQEDKKKNRREILKF